MELEQGLGEGQFFSDDSTLYKSIDENGIVNWTVADRGTWLPGIYDSPEACLKAVETPDEKIWEIWRKLNPVLPSHNLRYISLSDLS